MNFEDKAQGIRALVCGVDGVLTNGAIGYSSDNQQIHFFHAGDGLAMRLAGWHGLKVAWLTGRMSRQLAHRARHLDVPFYPGFSNKEVGLRIISREFDIPLSEIAYVGDDINDLLAFRVVGMPIAVANAAEEVKAQADYITKAQGGEGAVREVVEAILKAQGGWEAAVEQYLNVLREPERVAKMPRTEE